MITITRQDSAPPSCARDGSTYASAVRIAVDGPESRARSAMVYGLCAALESGTPRHERWHVDPNTRDGVIRIELHTGSERECRLAEAMVRTIVEGMSK